jgi:diacylglycerol kinase (ATP)
MAEPPSPPPPPGRALVIANPIAGAGRGEALAQSLARELESAGTSVELRVTRARGEAQRFAAQCSADVLVSVGGDGTLNEVLRGHRDPRVPLGILPLGTANVLALDLGLSLDPRRAAATILGGRTTPLDTALVNGELSFLAVGVGFDAEAVRQVEQRRRGPISKWTYLGAGLAALGRYREPQLEVELDGERIPGTFGWVLASNVIHFGGVFRLSPQRVLGDGLWEFYLFERAARRHLALHGLRLLTGRVPGPGIVLRQARKAAIRAVGPTATPPPAVQIDGDLRGALPLSIEVSGPTFRVLVPPHPEGTRASRRPAGAG